MLTQISQIPLNCTPGAKSHEGFTLLLKSEYSEHSEHSDTLHDLSANLCEI